VLGLADSGLDTLSCFFSDESEPVPFDTLSTRHRKIASYHTYIDALDAEGHGTLAAGAALGACASKKNRASTAFNGIAPGAKIAFLDIGRGSNTADDPAVIRPPSDVDANLFSVLYSDGARVMSMSWGINSNDYETYSRLLDKFMWEHPEALVVVAGGNDGERGFSSMYAPAVAKNCLAVGASLNDAASWDELLVGK
jgi:serine protease AprX